MEEIIAKITEILKDNDENNERLNITSDTRLLEDLKMDSVEIVEFIVDVEKKFDVSFEDTDDFIEHFYDVKGIAELIYSLLK